MEKLNVRQHDGSVVVVQGEEIEVCGVRCFRHKGYDARIKVISEYSVGLRVGTGRTYDEAITAAEQRITAAGPAVVEQLIKDCAERFGIANKTEV